MRKYAHDSISPPSRSPKAYNDACIALCYLCSLESPSTIQVNNIKSSMHPSPPPPTPVSNPMRSHAFAGSIFMAFNSTSSDRTASSQLFALGHNALLHDTAHCNGGFPTERVGCEDYLGTCRDYTYVLKHCIYGDDLTLNDGSATEYI